MSHAMISRWRQGGVGMVEVLAALFVLSVGLLGIAGLQAQGIRAGHSATLRSLAVIKSVEIIERMRANPDGIRDTVPNDSAYNVSFTGAGLDGQCDDTDAAGSDDRLFAPMPGIIKQVHAAAGEAVEADAPMIVMEAMKMELTLSAPRAGTIAEMLVSEGDQVADGDLLLQLDPA